MSGIFVFMGYYVYIIQSEKNDTFYKGSTSNYLSRLEEHNAGTTKSTRNGCPWKLIYVELHENKRDALIRERKLKKCKKEYFLWLAEQDSNLLRQT